MDGSSQSTDIFRIANPFRDPLRRGAFALAAGLAEHLFGLRRCAGLYGRITSGDKDEGFPARALEILGIECAAHPAELAQVPGSGPVVVVANHPFGAVEGIVLARLLRQIRPDVKFLANYLLGRLPEMRHLFIGVDPFGGRGAGGRNVGPLREAIRWLREGGMLVVFPAGEVSHLSIRRREVSDPRWSETLARIVRHGGAAAVPVHFAGRNSPLFHGAGLVHPLLRTALLPRELLNKRDSTIRVRVGTPVPNRKLCGFATDREMVAYLRLRTYLLGSASETETGAKQTASLSGFGPLAIPVEPELLAAEIGNLPDDHFLVESGPFRVVVAEAGRIPATLREIGRLREITFRQVGEGTGRPSDLDRFDAHYRHLFIWNREKCELVGAYRLGETDTIIQQFGMEGLYTSTLFTYRVDFLDRIGPALEVGRSFVRPEYQKSYTPLLLLWKGIGRFVAANPRYRVLFGAVSISREYSDLSRQLIVSTLQQGRLIPELARMVTARTPLRLKPLRVRGCEPAGDWPAALDLEDVAAMVADIEVDHKGVPVLLRHYVNLGGKFLGFNIDREFSDVLDGLVLVDLLETEGKTLERYMGKDGARAFLAWHSREGNEAVRRSA
ncbi:MAG: lysophospholipid acyltransferase family protein [Desulfuromonadales bacterium]|nr:MAG: lysophospholipid acyltransferase family protein [Desulfuromonadales bacterium]